jgi:hypothetical protein
MTQTRSAYMPLATYPEGVADEKILTAAKFASALGFQLHVRAFSVDIPQIHSPLGGLLFDVPGLVRAAEEKSKAECKRLDKLGRDSRVARQHSLLEPPSCAGCSA